MLFQGSTSRRRPQSASPGWIKIFAPREPLIFENFLIIKKNTICRIIIFNPKFFSVSNNFEVLSFWTTRKNPKREKTFPSVLVFPSFGKGCQENFRNRKTFWTYNTEAKWNSATHSDMSPEITDPERHLKRLLEMRLTLFETLDHLSIKNLFEKVQFTAQRLRSLIDRCECLRFKIWYVNHVFSVHAILLLTKQCFKSLHSEQRDTCKETAFTRPWLSGDVRKCKLWTE